MPPLKDMFWVSFFKNCDNLLGRESRRAVNNLSNGNLANWAECIKLIPNDLLITLSALDMKAVATVAQVIYEIIDDTFGY